MEADYSLLSHLLEANCEPLPPIADGDAFWIHFRGGLRALKTGKDMWRLEPLMVAAKPSRSGPLTKQQLYRVMSITSIGRPIGYHTQGWTSEHQHNHWVPDTGGKNLEDHPAALWRNIAFHRGGADDASSGSIQLLSNCISTSLRGMDISLSEVSEFYHYRLIESLFRNFSPGTKLSTSMDASLYVHVHSFFLHFGAARDYLGALIAMRLGLDFTSREGDSLVAILAHLSKHGRSEEPLVALLEKRGLIEHTKSGWRQGGWLSRMTKARNDVVHHRPYGRHECERNGTITDVHIDWGILSYRRGFFIEDAERELLDTLSSFYRETMILFRDIVRASGYPSEPPVLTDADLVGK